MARPRKNVNALTGAYTKEDMEKRKSQEEKIKGNCDKLFPPSFIENDEIALNKFYEICEELKKADILSNVDVDLLSIYCDCYSKYIKSTIILTTQDLVELQESKLGTSRVPNPYIKVQQSYIDRMLKISSLFGLSPSDRSKIAHLTPKDEDEKVDPLMDLLKGLRK